MNIKDRKNILYIAVLYIVFEILYLVSLHFIAGKGGFPLDDTWIHMRYAENLFNGHFYEYNIGTPTPGTTSPMWVILLSIGFIFSEIPIIYSVFLSSLFFLLTLITTYLLGLKTGLSRKMSLFVTLLVLLAGRMLWASLSGMEITLFTFLTLVITYIHLKEVKRNTVYFYTGILLGVATTVRPEGGLFAFIYYLMTIIFFTRNVTHNYVQFFISIVFYIIIALPYPIFTYIHTGSFFPNTYHGLYAEIRIFPDFLYLIESAKLFFKDNFILLLLWLAAIIHFARKMIKGEADKTYIFIFLWIILLPLISSILIPNWRHHGRYLVPLIPFIYLAIFRMLHNLRYELERRRLLIYRTAFISIVLFLSFAGSVLYSYLYGWNVENINNQQVKIAEWVNENLKQEQIIALNDIGAIGFLTKKNVFDTEGLVSPEIFARTRGKEPTERSKEMLRMVKEKGINYMIIYPHWYEDLMAMYGNGFEQVYSVRLRKNTICGGIEMFIFKINWDKINLG